MNVTKYIYISRKKEKVKGKREIKCIYRTFIESFFFFSRSTNEKAER